MINCSLYGPVPATLIKFKFEDASLSARLIAKVIERQGDDEERQVFAPSFPDFDTYLKVTPLVGSDWQVTGKLNPSVGVMVGEGT